MKNPLAIVVCVVLLAAVAVMMSQSPGPAPVPSEQAPTDGDRQSGPPNRLGTPPARAGGHADVRREQFTYSDLLTAAERKQVRRADLRVVEGVARVQLKDGSRHEVTYPPTDDQLAVTLAEAGAEVALDNDGVKPSRPGVLTQMLPLLIIIGLFVGIVSYNRWRVKRGKGSTFGTGVGGPATALRKSSEIDERPSVRFRDVAGCDEAVEEVKEIASYFANRPRYLRLGAKLPAGVMLYGPSGTGKTLLAKALAGETGRAFYAVSGSEFVEKYVGVGASRVRELFQKARQQPSIIFFDEIDALGKRRSGAGDSGNDEREQTLNQLLVELDGFDGRDDVIVIGATNRLDTLDPALLRPGRFTLHVEVGLPNEAGRAQILRVHAQGKPLGADVNLDAIAAMTYGMAGAQLAEVVNQAALMAARQDKDVIEQADLREGYMRVIMGPEKAGQVASEDEREIIAWHEAGHALCGELLVTQDNPQFVSIRQRGKALGVAVYGQTDRGLQSTQYLHEQLMCILGGRAAEYVKFNTVSSGAANDLQKANAVARQAVEQLGLSPRIGQLISEAGQLSDETRKAIDVEVERLLADAYAHAIELLHENREALDRLAELLLASDAVERLELQQAIGTAAPTQAKRQPALGPQPAPVLTPAVDDRPAQPRVRTPRRRRPVPALASRLAAVLQRAAERSEHGQTVKQ